MFKASDIIIDANKTFGSKLWLVEVAPYYEYKDGEKTNTVSGYKYTVALPERNLEKVGVKIAGAQLADQPKGYVECKFTNLEAVVYLQGASINITAKADSIALMGNKQ